MKRSSNLFLGLASAGTVLLLYLPLVLVMVFSFNSAPRGMVWESFTLSWYRDVWKDHLLLLSLKNTLLTTSLTAFLSVAIGLASAYVLSLSRTSTFVLFSGCLFVPIVLPELILAMAQSLLYRGFGMEKGLFTISVSQASFGTAYVALLVSARLRSINFRECLLAAEALGASEKASFLYLFLPLSLPATVSALSIVVAICLQDFIFAFFCGGVGSSTLSVRLYGMVKFGLASTVNVVYTCLFLCVAGLFILSEQNLKRRLES